MMAQPVFSSCRHMPAITSCALGSGLFLGSVRTGFAMAAAPDFALACSTVASAHINTSKFKTTVKNAFTNNYSRVARTL